MNLQNGNTSSLWIAHLSCIATSRYSSCETRNLSVMAADTILIVVETELSLLTALEVVGMLEGRIARSFILLTLRLSASSIWIALLTLLTARRNSSRETRSHSIITADTILSVIQAELSLLTALTILRVLESRIARRFTILANLLLLLSSG